MSGQVKNYNVALVQETTPGTYEPPAAPADFFEMAEPPTINTDQEVIERAVVRGGLGQLKSRRGLKISTIELALELKSSGSVGTEFAGVTDVARMEQFVEATLGGKLRRSANDAVSGGGSTVTNIDTVASDYFVGEGVAIVLATGIEVRHVKSIPGANEIELNHPLSVAPADTDVIIRGSNIFSDSGDDTRYSLTAYEEPPGDTSYRNDLFGMVVASLAFNDITNGSIPKLGFTFEGIDWDVTANVTNPITPSFENSVPPDNLNVLMHMGGIDVDSNNFQLTIDKEVQPKKVITNDSGVLERVPTSRNISGSFDYFPDPSDQTLFDLFEQNTTTDLHVAWGNVDVNNKFLQGSIMSVYMPTVQLTSGSPDEEDGFIKRTASYNTFEEGTLDTDIYIFVA